MQLIKGIQNIGVIKEVAHTDVILSDSLAKVVDKFEIEKSLSPFNMLKNKGFTIASLLRVSIIMPFEGVANVYALLKHGITGMVLAQKDAYYSAKNNEHIDWRLLLYKTAKRFKHLVKKDVLDEKKRVTAIIFDDTLLEKTGKGIEKISLTFDHVTKRFVLGYKLLLCGFWDGASFIPLDFTLHREKGSKQEETNHQYHRTTKALGTTKELLKKAQQQFSISQKNLLASGLRIAYKPYKLNHGDHKNTLLMCQMMEEKVQSLENQLIIDTKAQADAKQKLKRMYSHGRLFGLTKAERLEQYKKCISAKCCGYTRRKEADKTKGEQLIAIVYINQEVVHLSIEKYTT